MFLQDRDTDCDLGRAMTAATSRTQDVRTGRRARRSSVRRRPYPGGGGPRSGP